MDVKNTNVKPWPKQGLSDHVRAAPEPVEPRPTREQAEAAVRTLIAYAGDNPSREGLLETPKRVIGAYEEIYQGYNECPVEVLDRTFSETGGYDDFVLVRDITFNSHCEHHMMPFYGKAHVAYMPVDRVVGLCRDQVPAGIVVVRIDRRRVAKQIRLPLVGVAADKAIEIIETHASRPLVEWPGLASLELRRVMVFAEP